MNVSIKSIKLSISPAVRYQSINNTKMSQHQPRRPQEGPIKYGDVFNVSGELASKPIAPQDAATMQSAENRVMGQTQKGGPASVMASAANKNENAGFVGHDQASVIFREEGVTVAEAEVGGTRIITEAIGEQVVGQYLQSPEGQMKIPPAAAVNRSNITIGEALEATVLSAGSKPVEQSDVAAIQAAEVRATGRGQMTPGGVAAAAQSAATANVRIICDENKTKLADVLADATTKLPDDKPVTAQDAEAVTAAEMRNRPELSTHPGGVAASVVAAARLNQEK